MYIITLAPQEDGGRPALQTWDEITPPEGYALCPEEYHDVFYSTNPAGFVNIEVEDGVVTAMEVNQEAYDAYVAANPAEPETDPKPTTEERIATLEAENKLLTQQVEALSGQNDFLEECIVEMAGIVYA